MPIIDYPRPDGSGLVWGCDFQNRLMVQSQGGIIVGSTIGNGISPTAASSRVTFPGSESVCSNAMQTTIVMRFKTPSVNEATAKAYFSKTVNALTNNQFFMQMEPGFLATLYIAASVGDFSQTMRTTAGTILASTEYTMAFVTDLTLAAALRGKIYSNGAAITTTLSLGFPTRMQPGVSPITIFNRDGGSTLAPHSSTIIRSLRIYNRAFSAAEVADDYANGTFSEVFS
jgi:hypothetical protein